MFHTPELGSVLGGGGGQQEDRETRRSEQSTISRERIGCRPGGSGM